MISFGEYLHGLLENVTREGQVEQFQKSLVRLNKAKKSLAMNGMDTSEIDSQIDQINSALHRRMSATHQWHGAIVRVDQEPINNVVMWRLTNRDGDVFHIPVADAKGVIKIPPFWHQYPSPQKPMNKFIEYRTESWGSSTINLITYAENRTVDVVPFRTQKDKAQYYLIKRKNSGLWATVGGHIEEGELDNPIATAHRELKEETNATAMVIRQLPGGWIRETVSNPDSTPAADYYSWTLPYIAIVNPNFQMIPADDAIGGAWFDVGDIPGALHFKHHKDIIQQAFDFLPHLMKQFGKH